MSALRTNEVTFKGNAVGLAGTRLAPGDKAPDFECVNEGLACVSLSGTGAKPRLFSVVPSLDTPVCATQTQRISEEINALGDKIAAFTISLDLPFAMKRFCGDKGITNLTVLSDAHNHSFGEHYGVLIKSLPIPLLCRAIFVVDASDTITYVEYVSEITQEPDYPDALAALTAAVGA